MKKAANGFRPLATLEASPRSAIYAPAAAALTRGCGREVSADLLK